MDPQRVFCLSQRVHLLVDPDRHVPVHDRPGSRGLRPFVPLSRLRGQGTQGHRPFFTGLLFCPPTGGDDAADAAPAATFPRYRGHDDPALHLGHRGLRYRVLNLRDDRGGGVMVRLPETLRRVGAGVARQDQQDRHRIALLHSVFRPDPWCLGRQRACPGSR